MDPHELKERWLNRALESAGVDRARWRPGRGVDANRDTIEAVYDYYGRLFLEHPHLEWAGMASMIGPAFYAGFRDIGLLPDAVRSAVVATFGRASSRLARIAAGDLGFHETTFLTMQKQIFEDQATMHEAYLADGVQEIERLYRARIIDQATLEAWRQIDAGRSGDDPGLLARGNRTLLFREQHDIIDRFYVRMLRHRPPEGPVFTYLLTLAGAPSVPGAHSYPERYPLTFLARVPRATISVRTPLADGNIAMFANRWRLIDEDTLPDYLAFIRERPDEAQALVATPISERIGRFRLAARAGRLAAAAITRWNVDLAAVRAAPRLAVAATKPVLDAKTAGATIDLTDPPSRESAGFGAGSASRVWMNPDHRPFDVTVALPDGRAYRARAELAVMLSSARGQDPDRLSIRLPAAGLDEAARTLAGYAERWGFPAETVSSWRAGAERRALSDRDYSTHVFTPDEVGFVRVEFQVSDHVREGELIVSALFTWEPRLDRRAPPSP